MEIYEGKCSQPAVRRTAKGRNTLALIGSSVSLSDQTAAYCPNAPREAANSLSKSNEIDLGITRWRACPILPPWAGKIAPNEARVCVAPARNGSHENVQTPEQGPVGLAKDGSGPDSDLRSSPLRGGNGQGPFRPILHPRSSCRMVKPTFHGRKVVRLDDEGRLAAAFRGRQPAGTTSDP